MDCTAYYHSKVKQLVACSTDIKGSWPESLWDAGNVETSSNDEDQSSNSKPKHGSLHSFSFSVETSVAKNTYSNFIATKIKAVLTPRIINMMPLKALNLGASHFGIRVVAKQTKHMNPSTQYNAVFTSKAVSLQFILTPSRLACK